MEIITARLLLRAFTEKDLCALTIYQSDSRYVEFWPEEVNASDLLSTFQRWAVANPRHNYQLAVTSVREAHELIGTCGVRTEGLDRGMADFGIELAPQHWGLGYATEAAGAMLSFAFHHLDLGEVRAYRSQRTTALPSSCCAWVSGALAIVGVRYGCQSGDGARPNGN